MEVQIHNQVIKYANREEYFKMCASGQWEPESFDILDKYIKPGKVFIDIGAWVGGLSLYAEKLGAEVYAIEPDNKARIELYENFLINNSKIKIYDCAISNKNGDQYLTTTSQFGDSQSSLLVRGGTKWNQETKVMTFETFIEFNHIQPEDICLIKIDTEGSELFIIPSMIEWLKIHKPIIYLSLHPYWTEDDILMKQLSFYEFHFVKENSYILCTD